MNVWIVTTSTYFPSGTIKDRWTTVVAATTVYSAIATANHPLGTDRTFCLPDTTATPGMNRILHTTHVSGD